MERKITSCGLVCDCRCIVTDALVTNILELAFHSQMAETQLFIVVFAVNLKYFIIKSLFKKTNFRASLVIQWLRIHLAMQGTGIRCLVWEDSTCYGATKPMCHNYWALAREPTLHKRSPHNEKPVHCNKEYPPLAATRESLCATAKTHNSQKPIFNK